MNMLFDQFFGLRNYQTNPTASPLALIALSPLEEYGRNGPLYAAIELYAKSGIAETFPGVSVLEYLSLPKELTVWLLEISERRRGDKAQTEQDLINKMNASVGTHR